jgi:hypothetical protein
VVHAHNSSTGELEAEGSQIPDHSELQIEFKSSLSCIMRPSLKKPKAGDVAQLVK